MFQRPACGVGRQWMQPRARQRASRSREFRQQQQNWNGGQRGRRSGRPLHRPRGKSEAGNGWNDCSCRWTVSRASIGFSVKEVMAGFAVLRRYPGGLGWRGLRCWHREAIAPIGPCLTWETCGRRQASVCACASRRSLALVSTLTMTGRLYSDNSSHVCLSSPPQTNFLLYQSTELVAEWWKSRT